jgi:hypothetical protein
LIEGQDIDVVSLVFFDDVGGVGMGVERVHEHEWYSDIVLLVQMLNLANRQVQEGHSLTNLDDGLWANAAHRGTKTSVELEHSQLAQELSRLLVLKLVVVNDLTLSRWCNTIPVPGSRLAI